MKYVRSIEPLKFKLRRWFLGEDNYLPDSLRETLFYKEDVNLEVETIAILTVAFMSADKDLYFGVTKKLIGKIYKKLGCFEKVDEKRSFYFDGPYRRKVSQFIEVSIEQSKIMWSQLAEIFGRF